MPRGDAVDQKMMEMFCAMFAQEIGNQLQAALRAEGMEAEVGFALMLSDMGEPPGAVAYASNVDRGDFLRLLDELRGKLANTLPAAPPGD